MERLKAMTLSDDGRRGSEAHSKALHRLDDARDHERTMHDAAAAARQTPRELHAATQAAAASEKTAAREAWVTWVERDY